MCCTPDEGEREGRRDTALACHADITRFDAMLGEVMAKRDALGLREDTILVCVCVCDDGSGEGRDPIVRFERACYLRNESWPYTGYAESERSGNRPAEALYRIDRDPREERDVASGHPELVREFRSAIEAWLEAGRARVRAAI